jgi:hypothetical protein
MYVWVRGIEKIAYTLRFVPHCSLEKSIVIEKLLRLPRKDCWRQALEKRFKLEPIERVTALL